MLDTRFPGPNNITRMELPNGIVLLIYQNVAGATAVMEGVVRAGALYDPPGQDGLADFTADLLMRSTQKRSFDQIFDALESVGASLDFGSGRHTTQFSAHGLVEDLDLMLDLLGESLRRPTFPTEQIGQVRGQVLTGLQIRANDTRRMANLRFMETCYQNHPYGRSVRGYPETIQNMTRDDIVAFHQTHYGPRDMVIAVVSPLEPVDIAARISAELEDWVVADQPGEAGIVDVDPPVAQQVTATTIPDKQQADIVLGLAGPRRNAPDYLHLSLMNTVLGVFGMMGRIGKSVREEQGLAYYAYSRLSGGLGPTPWTAAAGVAPDAVTKAIDSILAEVRRMRAEPVSAEELADCKAYRTGSLPVSLETNSALADVMLDMELYGLGLDYLQRFPNEIAQISAEDILAAAQTYLDIDKMTISVAGPE